MQLIDELAAVRAIHETKARYFRFMDTRDFESLEKQFTPDAKIDISLSAIVTEPGFKGDLYTHPDRMQGGVFNDTKEFLIFLAGLLKGVRSVHQGHMSEITLLAPDHASGIWAFEDFLDFPAGSELEGKPIHMVHGHGHYWEEYRLTADGWKISSMKITRLREVRN